MRPHAILISLIFISGVNLATAQEDATSDAPVDEKCGKALTYDIAFTDDQADDRLSVELRGDCDAPETQYIDVTITDESGQQWISYSPEFMCGNAADKMGEIYTPNSGAPTDRPTTRSEQLPSADEVDADYIRIENKELYERARKTGGPLVCFTSYDYGGVCAWFDTDNKSAHILFEEGS